MNNNFLILDIFIIFIVKIFFKILKLDFNFFIVFILIFKFLEKYIISTTFGKRLKGFEEKIFNSEIFQSFLFNSMLLESFFFSGKEMKLGFFGYFKVFILRTLWVCVTWEGFCLFSDDSLKNWDDITPLIIFFATTLYLKIRSKVLNYQFLCVDNTFILWSEIIQKLQMLGGYRIANKLHSDCTFFLLSFQSNRISYPSELNVSTLSSTKRTMGFDTVVRAVRSIDPIDHFGKLWAAILASGAIGNTIFRHFHKQDDMKKDATDIIKAIPPLEEKIDQTQFEIFKNLQELKILKMSPTSQNFLLAPFFKPTREPKIERQIDLIEFKLNQLYKNLVRFYLELIANNAVLVYFEEAQKNPIFKPDLHHLARRFINSVDLESLIALYRSDNAKFHEVANTIAQKIIVEECSLKELATDSYLLPYLKLGPSDLIEAVVESIEVSCYEDSSSFTMLDYVD